MIQITDCQFETFLIDSRYFRKGILIKLTADNERVVFAEASPLPGFSDETLEEVLEQLIKLKRRLLSTYWTKGTLNSLSTWGLYPSVYFALESALMDLIFPLATYTPCQKYGLVFGSTEEMQTRADEIYAEGIRELKVKLGHLKPKQAHEMIERLRDRFALRIDLNRKWSSAESLSFCKEYPEDFFTYIEEPCHHPKDLLSFPYPFALDESLKDISDLSPYLHSAYLKALIIKPTLLYPIAKYLRLGPKIILTSSFEGTVGIGQIERLATRLDLLQTKHGLDTLRYCETHHDPMSDHLLEKTLS